MVLQEAAAKEVPWSAQRPWDEAARAAAQQDAADTSPAQGAAMEAEVARPASKSKQRGAAANSSKGKAALGKAAERQKAQPAAGKRKRADASTAKTPQEVDLENWNPAAQGGPPNNRVASGGEHHLLIWSPGMEQELMPVHRSSVPVLASEFAAFAIHVTQYDSFMQQARRVQRRRQARQRRQMSRPRHEAAATQRPRRQLPTGQTAARLLQQRRAGHQRLSRAASQCPPLLRGSRVCLRHLI